MKIPKIVTHVATGSLVAALAVFGLSSCGGDEDVNSASGSTSASLAPAIVGMFTAGQFGINVNQAPDTIPSFTKLGFKGSTSGLSVQASAVDPLADCQKSSPDTVVDADGDGIALEKNYEADCTNVLMNDGFTFTLKSKMVIRDLDDTVRYTAGGYSFDIDYEGSTLKVPQYDFSWNHRGHFSAIPGPTSFTVSSKYSAGFSGREREDYWDFTWKSNYSMVYTPLDMSAPYVAGAVKYSGFVGIEGNLVPEQLEKFVVAFQLDSVDLIYDYANCSYYKSGSLYWTDGAGQKVESRYHCSGFDTYFEGQKIDLP